MPIQKQNVEIPFSGGLDLKTDPWQVVPGKFLALNNSVFTTSKRLTKRNGFPQLTSLPDTTSLTLSTFKGNLTAMGTSLFAYASDINQWVNTGSLQPLSLSVISAARRDLSITQCDSAVAPNGLACTVFTDSSGATYYQILDSATSQIILASAALPGNAQECRVFVLARNFIITFLQTVSGTVHLRYVAVPLFNLMTPSAPSDLSSQVKTITAGYDGVVANNTLFVAWFGSDATNTVRATSLNSALVQSNVVTFSNAAYEATLVSVCADDTQSIPSIWINFWGTAANNGYSIVLDTNLNTILAPTQVITSQELHTLTSFARNQTCTLFLDNVNTYGFSSVATNFLSTVNVTQAGMATVPNVIVRSLGLASKAFYMAGTNKAYVLGAFQSAYQPSYFLIDSEGNVVCKLAYSNGAGYAATQVLPAVTVTGSLASISYLFKAQLVAVNKTQGVVTTAGIYGLNGVNIASFTINDAPMDTAEIGNNLHLAGGFLWMYDGVKPVEHGFHVWPEELAVATTGSGGDLAAQQYYYQAIYQWTDAQGNVHSSAPNPPVGSLITTPSSSNEVHVPTLRLTYKTGNNQVRIVIYRWSAAQQNYYQITSVTSPLLNDPTADSVSFVDTFSDADILGNPLIYTTGGVIENIAAPACRSLALYRNRLMLINAEDPNSVWYSKQVIETTPVETSDLFTLYVAPTTGAQGSTGEARTLSAMDDKFIVFKKDAEYYFTGNGPDNTGASNDFSDPIFISAAAGCDNQQSIILTPTGIMFQSDKGIWQLGRDLSTTYIGQDVEAYNTALITSSVLVPATTQVRFSMANGSTLMYDYFFQQWGTFTGLKSISDTIYSDLHTYLNKFGQVFQEKVGTYLDGSLPVLMSFTTSWYSFASLQGFQRLYFFYLLGEYVTPFKLNVGLAYDYDPSISQNILVIPDNFSPKWGQLPLWGGGETWGGPSTVLNKRLFNSFQKCQSFQITVSEQYDPSYGVVAGAGLTLSGLNLVVGTKKGYTPVAASQSAG